MHALKLKLLGNRCSIKNAFSHIFIRIQVGYTVQYIDILKSYLNLNKYISVFYGASIFKYLGFNACIPVQGITVPYTRVRLIWVNTFF